MVLNWSRVNTAPKAVLMDNQGNTLMDPVDFIYCDVQPDGSAVMAGTNIGASSARSASSTWG